MKSKRFTIIGKALPLVLAVITLSVQAAGRSYRQINPALVSRAEQVTGDKFPIVTTTPRGVTVLARTMPRLDLLNAIDRGLADLFAVAQRHGYRNRMRFDDYRIFTGRADRTKDSKGQYSPDIAVPAQQYAGSDYDERAPGLSDHAARHRIGKALGRIAEGQRPNRLWLPEQREEEFHLRSHEGWTS